jgi:hypothetical protein
MLVATKRHPYRPAHVHFMIAAEGFETLVTHVFVAGDPYLDSDAVFGVKNSLISNSSSTARGRRRTARSGPAVAIPPLRLRVEAGDCGPAEIDRQRPLTRPAYRPHSRRLERQRNSLADPDAHRTERVTRTAFPELQSRRPGEPRAGHSERVA